MVVDIDRRLIGDVERAGGGGQGTIKIGYLDDLSDAAAESGNDSLHGAEQAVKEINAAGGVNGRQIELVVYDVKESADLAVGFVRRVAQEGVVAFAAGAGAVPVAAEIPVAGQLKLPMIGLAAATDAFTATPQPYYLRIGPSNSQDATAVAKMRAAFSRASCFFWSAALRFFFSAMRLAFSAAAFCSARALARSLRAWAR